MTNLRTDGYTLVAAGPDRLRDIVDLDQWAFVSPQTVDEQVRDDTPASAWPWGRTYLMLAPDGAPAAFHDSLPFARFAVPGAFVAAAGLSCVSVHPQHRRRGLLTAMIEAHFAHCAQRGEAISVLDASEPAIYGRFGYGQASDQISVTVPRGAALRDVAGSADVEVIVDHADADRYLDAVLGVQRDAAWCSGLVRPGWVGWESREVGASFFRDPPARRQADNRETRRIMLACRDGRPVGYAFFHRKLRWPDNNPRGEVEVTAIASTDAAAAHALWSRLSDLDLMATTSTMLLAVDDPLLGMLVDQRAALPKRSDGLWVRLVDVPKALASRQYACDIDVVVEVADARVPSNAGAWRLRADAFSDGAVVTRSTDEPDIVADVRELGAAYLGGTSLAALAAAGQLTARTPDALARASVAFGWPLAPTFNWIF